MAASATSQGTIILGRRDLLPMRTCQITDGGATIAVQMDPEHLRVVEIAGLSSGLGVPFSIVSDGKPMGFGV